MFRSSICPDNFGIGSISSSIVYISSVEKEGKQNYIPYQEGPAFISDFREYKSNFD
jgi:hypothetical protein